MRETSSRLLRLLSLLQRRREWSGTDLATELDITTRTLRRDVDQLRELGYPVNSRIGVGGGYQLGAGGEMPPLLLDDDETVAVAFGLQSGASGPVIGIGEPSLRALTKLRQVMPSRLQHRLDGLQVEVAVQPHAKSAVDAKVLATVAWVCHARDQLRFDYLARNGTGSRREVEPYRVVRVETRWYLFAWDLERQDWRSFRIDRMTLKVPTGPRFELRELPEGGASSFILSGIHQASSQVQVRVRLHAPIEQVAARVPRDWATAETESAGSCVLTLRGESYGSIVPWLSMFDVAFTVLEPLELREACRDFADHHTVLAARYSGA